MTDEIRAYYAQALDEDKNIVAVGEGPNGKTILWVLDDTLDAIAPYTARAAEGELEIHRTQRFMAYQIPTGRFRPAPGGVTGGSHRITGGTLGGVVHDITNDRMAYLSCTHVFCGDLDGELNDDILQPSAIHGGVRNGDTIARLTRWQPLKVGVTSIIDSAIADVLRPEDASLNVLGIGYMYGSCDPYPGQFLHKMGARTVLSKGWVTAVKVKARVDYGPGKTISLDDLFMCTTFSGPGDSGSLLLDFSSNAGVGVLFAGDGMFTLGSTMRNAARILNFDFYEPPERMRSQLLDISHWQGDINTDIMLDRQVRGLIMKVSQGGSLRDSRFRGYYDQAGQAGMLRGGYIFVDPNHSPQAHWDNFLAHLDGRKLEIPIALDCESRGQNGAESSQTITACIQGLSNLVLRDFGYRPLIYTSPGFWNQYVLPWSEWANHPLWIANWTEQGMTPLLPRDWTSLEQVAIWQHFVVQNGPALGVESTAVDVNRTYRLFERIIEGGTPPPPPPDHATLSITIEGRGFVSPSGGVYPIGETLQLQAMPEDGWHFVGWGGDADGEDNPLQLVMDGNKSIIAVFESDGGAGPAEFIHYQGVTQVRGQNIRRVPTTANNTPVGVLDDGQTIRLFEFVEDPQGNTWANIGWDYTRKCNLYAAVLHNGTEYIKVTQNE